VPFECPPSRNGNAIDVAPRARGSRYRFSQFERGDFSRTFAGMMISRCHAIRRGWKSWHVRGTLRRRERDLGHVAIPRDGGGGGGIRGIRKIRCTSGRGGMHECPAPDGKINRIVLPSCAISFHLPLSLSFSLFLLLSFLRFALSHAEYHRSRGHAGTRSGSPGGRNGMENIATPPTSYPPPETLSPG